MRLLTTSDPDSPKLEEYFEPDVPSYAILSHTWEKEEVTFQILQQLDDRARQMAGFRKIVGTCKLAREQGFSYVWVDTCCIDKTSSAELSEAINSMFRWYRQAEVCYAFLQDYSALKAENLRDSRWFYRGWTLQELIAPGKVEFYAKDWRSIGTKMELRNELSTITGIPGRVLEGASLKNVCAAQKMYWASGRQTRRVEDAAYSLMGLFDIHMPLLYGEGPKAFYRLQEEILRRTQDHTLLAWRGSIFSRRSGLFAKSPQSFRESYDMFPIYNDEAVPLELTHKGVRMQLPTRARGGHCNVALDCQLVDKEEGTRRC